MTTWHTVVTIEAYLMQGFSDMGLDETYDDDGKFIDSDDLRIAIELSGGPKIVLDLNCRLVIRENGDIDIQRLM